MTNKNEEFDIFSVIEILTVKFKSLMLVSTSLIGLIYILNIYFFPTSYNASITISPQSIEQVSKYQPINEIDIFPKDFQPIITREKIYENFKSQLKNKDILFNSIIKNSSKVRGMTNIDEIRTYASSLSSNLKVSNNRDNADIELTVVYNNRDDIKNILSTVVEETNKSVAQSIIIQIDNLKSVAVRNHKKEIREIENDINLIKFNKDLNLESRISYLQEQLAIAKKLNINEFELPPTSIEVGQPVFEFTEISPTGYDDKSPPYYIRGVKAIEEEIAQLTNRKNNKNYLSTRLSQLITDLENLNNNLQIDEMEKNLSSVSLSSDKFSAINTNISFIKVSKSSSTLTFLLLTSFFSILITSISILTIEAYKKYLKNK